MLKQIANTIALQSGKDEEIILYGLTIFVNTLFGYLFLLTTAFFFKWIELALAAAITASIFRAFTGGAHAKTNFKCILNGAIIFNAIAFIASFTVNFLTIDNFKIVVVLVGIFAIIMIYTLAPVTVPEKPINSKLHRKVFKALALVLGPIWFLLIYMNIGQIRTEVLLASAGGLVWQMFTLTRCLEYMKLL